MRRFSGRIRAGVARSTSFRWGSADELDGSEDEKDDADKSRGRPCADSPGERSRTGRSPSSRSESADELDDPDDQKDGAHGREGRSSPRPDNQEGHANNDKRDSREPPFRHQRPSEPAAVARRRAK